MNAIAPEYRIKRSQRAKRTRIIVKADGIVEVVAPEHVSERSISAFVHAQRDWIDRSRQRLLARQQAVVNLAPIVYETGVSVPYQGQQLPLLVIPTTAKTMRVSLRDSVLQIVLPDFVAESDRSSRIRAGLSQWMKQRARERALSLLQHYASSTGLQARSLSLKTMKSRWGSCGPKNDINLNWLLILAPPIILEYVVVHELCHIRHKNHSEAFWQLVAQLMPDYAQHRLWLKHNGASLMQGL